MSGLDYLAAECLMSISSGALIHPASSLLSAKEERGGRPASLPSPRHPGRPDSALSDCSGSCSSSCSPAAGEVQNGVPVLPQAEELPRRAGADSPASPSAICPAKRHQCPFQGCVKVYGKSSHLKAHLRTHTAHSHGGYPGLRTQFLGKGPTYQKAGLLDSEQKGRGGGGSDSPTRWKFTDDLEKSLLKLPYFAGVLGGPANE